MSDLDGEVRRLIALDLAVRNYLSNVYALEQGDDADESAVDAWREQLELLTSGEPASAVMSGLYLDDDGNVWEVD